MKKKSKPSHAQLENEPEVAPNSSPEKLRPADRADSSVAGAAKCECPPGCVGLPCCN